MSPRTPRIYGFSSTVPEALPAQVPVLSYREVGLVCLCIYSSRYSNSPAYRHRDWTDGGHGQYLYRHKGEDWRVGPELGGSSSSLLNRTNTGCTYDVKGEWQPDPEFTVTTNQPSICEVLIMSFNTILVPPPHQFCWLPSGLLNWWFGGFDVLHKAIARARRDWRPRGYWSAGRPVFSNGLTYLRVKPLLNNSCWWVTDNLWPPTLESSCVTWCPASPRAAVSHRLGEHDSWKVRVDLVRNAESSSIMLDGDIRFTCNTHQN